MTERPQRRYARLHDDHTFVLPGDQRADFPAGRRIRLRPDGPEREVIAAALVNGETRVSVRGASLAPHDDPSYGLSGRLALRVHAATARLFQNPPGEEPGVIHNARRYDLMWGWLIGRTDGAILRLLAVCAGERVLEIGCGPGRLAGSLQRAVGADGSVTAIDAAPEMIERARRTAGTRPIRFAVTRAERLPYPDAGFDAVVSRLVMHELGPHLPLALDEIVRVLSPGGRALLIDLPGAALDDAAADLTNRGFSCRRGTVGFPFLQYVSFGIERHDRVADGG